MIAIIVTNELLRGHTCLDIYTMIFMKSNAHHKRADMDLKSLLEVAMEAKEYFQSGVTTTMRITNKTENTYLKFLEFSHVEDDNTALGVMPPLFLKPGDTHDCSLSASKFFTSDFKLSWTLVEDINEKSPEFVLDVEYLWEKENKGKMSVRLDNTNPELELPFTEQPFYKTGQISYSSQPYLVSFIGSGSTSELIITDKEKED